MGTRVKVFTDLLNLGHEKVTKTLWQVCNGNVRWQRGSLCFAEQFVRHSKKLFSGRTDVYLAAIVKLPGVPYASLHCGPLLDEEFPSGQSGKLTSSDALPVVVFCVPLWPRQSTTALSVGGWRSGWPEGRGGPWLHGDQHCSYPQGLCRDTDCSDLRNTWRPPGNQEETQPWCFEMWQYALICLVLTGRRSLYCWNDAARLCYDRSLEQVRGVEWHRRLLWSERPGMSSTLSSARQLTSERTTAQSSVWPHLCVERQRAVSNRGH